MREKIKSIPVDSVVLVRSLGIILDNAIEAAEEIKNGYIRVAILHDKNLIKIIVANSCKQDIPKLFLLKRDGFSTKGENRGLGLGNLDQLLNKSKNIILETKIEKSVFTQILTINEEGKV
nr:GHKL domain-containing protein [Lysinibacillus xylanilyticus]